MKKLLSGVMALGLWAGAANAADDLTLQLKWVTQAQFGGYYVALEKGFYEEEDLNVTIKPGGPDIAPVQVLMGGGADVMVDWLPSALAAREQGALIVNIAQPFSSSGLMLICLKVKWSGKTGQSAKVYPTLKNGYSNDNETPIFG